MKTEYGQKITNIHQARRHIKSGGTIQESPNSRLVMIHGECIHREFKGSKGWCISSISNQDLSNRKFIALP